MIYVHLLFIAIVRRPCLSIGWNERIEDPFMVNVRAPAIACMVVLGSCCNLIYIVLVSIKLMFN